MSELVVNPVCTLYPDEGEARLAPTTRPSAIAAGRIGSCVRARHASPLLPDRPRSQRDVLALALGRGTPRPYGGVALRYTRPIFAAPGRPTASASAAARSTS